MKGSRKTGEEELDYGRYVFSKKECLHCLLVSLGLSGLVAWLFYRSPWGMLLFPAVCLAYAGVFRGEQRKKRQERLMLEFQAVMQALSTALLAGYSMENAWRDAEREITALYGKESLMLPEVRRINAAVRLNEPVEQLLAEFAKRSACEEIESFAAIFLFAKRSGGDFVKIIQTTVKKLTGRMEVEQEIATVLAGKRLEGRVMNAMPLLILAYMTLTSGDFLDVLYGNTFGVCVMTAVLAGYGMALRLSAHVLEIEI